MGISHSKNPEQSAIYWQKIPDRFKEEKNLWIKRSAHNNKNNDYSPKNSDAHEKLCVHKLFCYFRFCFWCQLWKMFGHATFVDVQYNVQYKTNAE